VATDMKSWPGGATPRTPPVFCLLGPLLVLREGSAVHVPPGRQRALLAILLLNVNRPVSIRALIETLWGDRPPATAKATLQNHVKRLRQTLADTDHHRIATEAHGYMINVAPGELDLDRFEILLGAARAAADDRSWQQASAALRAALSLWRGAPLSGVACDVLTNQEVPRLAELRLQALEARIDADLNLGRHAEVISELRWLAAAHPLREHLHALLMLALYRHGQQADALSAYRSARATLVAELGTEPGPELRLLHHRILAGDPALAAPIAALRPAGTRAVAPPLRVKRVVPRQLPAAGRHFAGRSAELAALSGLLEEATEASGPVALAAITGMAGTGKTSLAVYWAHEVAERFPDGQLYVNLRGFGPAGNPVTPEEAIRGFLDAFQIPRQQIPATLDGQSSLYRSVLAGRRVLVLLDNARDAAQVRALLPGSAGCFALVTSRGQLTGLAAVEGASLLALTVLTRKDAQELLRKRLSSSRATGGPAIGGTAADELIELCARLPLALTIATARAATRPGLPLAAVVAELRTARSRLDVLDTGDPAANLRAVFSWSYQNLGPVAARLFRLSGVAVGPDITVPAAASLAGMPAAEASRALDDLTRANVLSEHARGRFSCHDLLRAYAAERAAAEETARERAAAAGRLLTWLLHTAAAATRVVNPRRRHVPVGPAVSGCEPLAFGTYDDALAWLDAERVSLIAAVGESARRGRHETAWQLAIVLWDLFDVRGHLGDWIAVLTTGLASARFLRDRAAEAWLLSHLAIARSRAGEYSEAIACHQQSLAIRRETGDRHGEAAILANLGRTYREAGLPEQSMAALQEALAIFRDIGQRSREGIVLGNIGETCRLLGRFTESIAFGNEAVAIHRETGDRSEQGLAMTLLARTYLQLGQMGDAIRQARHGAELMRQLGHQAVEAEALTVLGQALLSDGQTSGARRSLQDAATIFALLGDPREAAVRMQLELC
jgi:DNA-binding SARP family transcriptional activator